MTMLKVIIEAFLLRLEQECISYCAEWFTSNMFWLHKFAHDNELTLPMADIISKAIPTQQPSD